MIEREVDQLVYLKLLIHYILILFFSINFY